MGQAGTAMKATPEKSAGARPISTQRDVGLTICGLQHPTGNVQSGSCFSSGIAAWTLPSIQSPNSRSDSLSARNLGAWARTRSSARAGEPAAGARWPHLRPFLSAPDRTPSNSCNQQGGGALVRGSGRGPRPRIRLAGPAAAKRPIVKSAAIPAPRCRAVEISLAAGNAPRPLRRPRCRARAGREARPHHLQSSAQSG